MTHNMQDREQEMQLEREQLNAGWESGGEDYIWQLDSDVWVEDPDEWDEE